ncbi:MAG: MerR family transcriptional regulator [Elainella sp.]
MKTLQQVAQQNPSWSLEELVQVANELLPQFLPDEKVQTRVREDVTPRLVRHYTSQGMLDEPLKAGREARYIYRHLLQVLVVRRLLTEGYGASVINTLARSKSNSDLEELLQGSVQLTVAPANPALTFLQQVQKRQSDAARSQSMQLGSVQPGSVQSQPVQPGSVQPQAKSLPSPYPSSTVPHSEWIRHEILPGLELHIRSDVLLPVTAQEQQTLLQRIWQILTLLTPSNRKSPKP